MKKWGVIFVTLLWGNHVLANEGSCDSLQVLDVNNKGTAEYKGSSWFIKPNKGTDLYTSPDGKVAVNKVPSLMSKPLNDFEFDTTVVANFSNAYDGAGILVYADKDSWAKFMFERFKSGRNGVASTVSRGNGDDTYHFRTEKEKMSLKVISNDGVFTFLYSFDGKEWLYSRSFKLNTVDQVRVGLFAQSPIGGAMTASFDKHCLSAPNN